MIVYESLPVDLRKEIEVSSKKMDVPPDQLIVSVGDRMEFIPFVLDGSVRVYIENEDTNKELLLYYVERGQTCMMSMIASFSDQISKVSAETESQSSLMLVPAKKIREWQMKYEEWNNLILSLFISRYNDLITTIEALSFKKIEGRLISYLENYTDHEGFVSISKTNSEIAKNIATSREVVSRTLKKLENDGKIKFKSS
ncbi:MAG: Crp/Fnr family transcriptional regulator [Flavobacteriaceae bacterium]